MGTLRVYAGDQSGSQLLFTQTGTAGNYWRFAQANITTKFMYEISFDAERGKQIKELNSVL